MAREEETRQRIREYLLEHRTKYVHKTHDSNEYDLLAQAIRDNLNITINPKEIRSIERDPDFRTALETRNKHELLKYDAACRSKLIDKALTGSIPHLNLYFKLTGAIVGGDGVKEANKKMENVAGATQEELINLMKHLVEEQYYKNVS